jgi:hypothetical protein
MAEFPVNPTRLDPYKGSRFRVKWDGKYVAAIMRGEPARARHGGGYRALGQLDASSEETPAERLTLAHEGWERDTSVREPVET